MSVPTRSLSAHSKQPRYFPMLGLCWHDRQYKPSQNILCPFKCSNLFILPKTLSLFFSSAYIFIHSGSRYVVILLFSLALISSECFSSAEHLVRAQIFPISYRSEGGCLLDTMEKMGFISSLLLFHSPLALCTVTRMAVVLNVSRACPNRCVKDVTVLSHCMENVVEINDIFWVFCVPMCGGREHRLLYNRQIYF